VIEERERLRATFDTAAQTYGDARPSYPDALLERLVSSTRVTTRSRLLEVGCGPGTATVPLAERGLRITAVELGASLAAVARARLRSFPDVEVVRAAFESWPPADHRYDLLYAATAWHWVDPDVRYRRAHGVLRPGGFLAFWQAAHVIPAGGDPFFAEIQEVYDEIGEGLPTDFVPPAPGELAEEIEEVEASGLFVVSEVAHFDWSVTYDADSYLRLLDTFSGHIAMEPEKRGHLYAEIRRRLARRPDGRLERHWGAVLHLARALHRPGARLG
jgi:SAM-dependent methyltransferase